MLLNFITIPSVRFDNSCPTFRFVVHVISFGFRYHGLSCGVLPIFQGQHLYIVEFMLSNIPDKNKPYVISYLIFCVRRFPKSNLVVKLTYSTGHCQNLVDFFMIHDAKPKTWNMTESFLYMRLRKAPLYRCHFSQLSLNHNEGTWDSWNWSDRSPSVPVPSSVYC